MMPESSLLQSSHTAQCVCVGQEPGTSLTKAAAADARTTPVALWALHKLVVVLGPLAAQCTPLAGATTHVTCTQGGEYSTGK